MKKHLYRVYGFDERRIALLKDYEELNSESSYHGLRTDRRGEIYALIESTRWLIFKARITVLAYDLTHRKNRYGLRFKRHKGEFIYLPFSFYF